MKKINFIDLQRQYKLKKDEIDLSILKVLEDGSFIQGPEVKELEVKLAEYTSTYALTVANGTDALIISLMGLGIGEGDEVITPSFTWVSTVEAIKIVGATPVYIDVREDTFNINESLIEDLITEKTKLIMPVSIFGSCSNLQKINEIAKKHSLVVLEDAAQSFGAKSNGELSCSIAEISTTSFFPAKPLGCYGDGGAIFTKNKDLYKNVSMISKHGQDGRYNYVRLGLNSRLDTIQAAVLLKKLEIFENEIALRNVVAENYEKNLSGSNLITTPKLYDDQNRSVWAQYTVLLDKCVAQERDKIMNGLRENSIPSALYYPAALHLQKPYFSDSSLLVTEDITSRVLSLPMHPYLEKNEIDYICEKFLSELNKYA